MGHEPSTAADSELDKYFIRTSLWPAIVYTSVLMIVGTVGNLLVLVVYRRHFQRSITRMFIYALALLDLGNCLITMPAELSILIHFTTFTSPTWCKVSRYLTYTFNGTSSIVLITIAMDRYFKVCKPMKAIMTLRRARIVCVSSFLITAVLSIPALIIYGEMEIPILVSDTGVTILPAEPDFGNFSTNSRAVFTSTGRPFTLGVPQSITINSHDTEVNSTAANGEPTKLVYGQFCLLSSEHINGKMPLMFYFSIFLLYIIMVVLVFFFYGQVARTMFTLTSKHAKMFSFYTHKNCTPSSNSANPEASNSQVKVQCSMDIISKVSAAEQQTKGSSSVLAGPKICSEDIGRVSTFSKSPTQNGYRHKEAGIMLSENSSGQIECETEDVVPTGKETVDLTSLCQEDVYKKNILTRDNQNVTHSMIKRTTYCNNQKSSQLININTKYENQMISSEFDNAHDHNNQMTGLKINETVVSDKNSDTRDSPNYGRVEDVHPENSRPSSETCPGIRKQEYTKRQGVNRKSKEAYTIPKIKLQKVDGEKCDSDQAVNSWQFPGPEPEPFFTNSLLRRRIQSAENIRHLSGLHMLQVPDGRYRGPWIPDVTENRSIRGSQRQGSSRNNLARIGQVTKSCVNLDYIVHDASSVASQEKTLTLTKTSSLGKKKLYVLPLRGMTQKTAYQGHEFQNTATTQNTRLSTNNGVLSKSDSRLHKDQDRCAAGDQGDTLFISTSTDDLASPVTLRYPASKSSSLPNDILTQIKFQEDPRTPRKKVPSTAEILQEHHRRGSLHPFRTSRMLFVISLVFVISFLPFFIIALMRSFVGMSFMALSGAELGVVSVFIRSSLISNAVNPIAYGVLSTYFRRECKEIMCCIFRR